MTSTISPELSSKELSPAVIAVNNVEADLAAAWSEARGLNSRVFPTKLPLRVLIKPNLCDIVSWETGATSDPAWLKVIVDELRAIRQDVQISVVESDAVGAYKTYRSCDETFERLGFLAAAEELSIELINLSKSETIDISLPFIPYPVNIPQMLLEEFFFISIANLKVHPYERMTGILKNSLGLLPQADIAHLHPYLSALISALYHLCPPDLCLIDGRVGLEGKGPIQGDRVPMKTVLFSNDALAADLCSSRLMVIPPKEVPHLRAAAADLGRSFDSFSISGDIRPHAFAFDPQNVHRQILLKFANRRFHRSSELFTNRWIDRLLLFKREPLTFLSRAVPKLARRLYGR
jgi:uncharacterized protein (DUF362 family)